MGNCTVFDARDDTGLCSLITVFLFAPITFGYRGNCTLKSKDTDEHADSTVYISQINDLRRFLTLKRLRDY